MPWIEGVGNEVTLFFASIFVVSIGFLAWLSTKINHRPLNRAIIVVHSRGTHPPTTQTYLVEPTSLTSPQDDSSVVQSEGNEQEITPRIEGTGEIQEQNNSVCETTTTTTTTTTTSTTSSGGSDDTIECLEILPTQTSTDEISTSTTPRDNILLKSQRISLLEPKSEPLINEGETHSSTGAVETTEPELDPGNIRIRLKYVTDEQRLVQGRLQESLGEFKVRNFVSELSAQKLVRLIFNGHILQRESETLQEHGLFDNCVVHCLIHQRQSSPEAAANQNAINNNNANPNRDWDLGTLFFVLLTILISFAWYCRFQYGQFFNIATTFTLIGLSGVFFVCLLGLYFPDAEGIRN